MHLRSEGTPLVCRCMVLVLVASMASRAFVEGASLFRSSSPKIDNHFSGNGKNEPVSTSEETESGSGPAGRLELLPAAAAAAVVAASGSGAEFPEESSGKGGAPASLSIAGPCLRNPSKADVPQRAMCPYKFSENVNKDRVPAVIMEAVATTKGDQCLIPGTDKHSTEGVCVFVTTDVQVKMTKTGETCMESVPVARVCVTPDEH